MPTSVNDAIGRASPGRVNARAIDTEAERQAWAVSKAMSVLATSLVVLIVLASAVSPARATTTPLTLPSVPAGWPTTFQLGMSSGPGDAGRMYATAPFGLRSQYLAGGANTGNGWAAWNPDGMFASIYARESAAEGIRPVFDYYMLLQSSPAVGADEAAKDLSNLNNQATMAAYYTDLKLFFTRTAPFAASGVVLHVEPDLWGYIEQRATGDDPRTVPAQVAGTGMAELAGLPDTAAGFAQAIVRLRDRYAPGVLLAYHLSSWGTRTDILYSKPDNGTIDALASRATAFVASLGAAFDLAFTDPSDRDAGFKQYVYGDGGRSWWAPADYGRNVRFLSGFIAASGLRAVLWQVPIGNTKMRAMNNTWDHYQDNHVEWLLDDPARAHLSDYAAAGVVGVIFGRGADGATCACDAAGDGVTDPPAIGGNTQLSLSADDDGGFFRARAAAYYSAGALSLPDAPPPGPCSPATGPGIPPPALVASGRPGLHAEWYGQSGYPTLCAGQRSTATVAFYNSGSIGWIRGRIGEVAYLGTWAPEPGQDQPSLLGGDGQRGSPDTAWPRYNRIAIQPADYIGPGQIAWFQFTIQAPAARGSYRLYLRPLIEGAMWLEDYGVYWIVTVQ